jgi:Tfp pilus assembly protein PilX
MLNQLNSKRGFALFVVLGTLILGVVLGNVIMSLILNHARLTQHQTGRIQAYYAALAGVNVAIENLRTGVWTYTPNSCADPGATGTSACLVTDASFNAPNSPIVGYTDGTGAWHPSVEIVFCPSGSNCKGSPSACTPPPNSNIQFCIDSTAHYLTRSATP